MGTDAQRGTSVSSLGAYGSGRLLLVGGCLAASAAAAFGGSDLPQRSPVALGAAFIGALLVLRPLRPPTQPEATAETEAEPADSSQAPRRRQRTRSARAREAQLISIAASLETHERRLEIQEQRLTSVSGRQSLIDSHAREQLSELQERLERLEAESEAQKQALRTLHRQHAERLARFLDSIKQHNQAIGELARSLDPRAAGSSEGPR